MANTNNEEKVFDCTNCIHKEKNKYLQQKIVESLKQLEGIKRILLNLVK